MADPMEFRLLYDDAFDKLFDLLGQPEEWPHPHWFRCPNGHLGTIDIEQYRGEVSIVCPECDFHGHRIMGELGKN